MSELYPFVPGRSVLFSTAPQTLPLYRRHVGWIISVVLVVGVVVLFRLSRGLPQSEEMGSVSGQWLAEYRQDHES